MSLLSPPDPAHTVGLNSRIPPTPPHDPPPPFPHPYLQAIARPTPGKNYPLKKKKKTDLRAFPGIFPSRARAWNPQAPFSHQKSLPLSMAGDALFLRKLLQRVPLRAGHEIHSSTEGISEKQLSEAWGPPQFQEKRSRSERAILGALREFRGILGAALGIGNSILGIRNSILGMASHDLSNTKPTILGATLGAIPGIAANPPERFSIGVVPAHQTLDASGASEALRGAPANHIWGRAKGAAKASCGETVVQKGVFGESVSSLPP